MSHGGNRPWKDFFDAHASNKLQGRTFDDCTIQERYDCDAGEEWKERLSAKVEGKEYVPGTRSSGLVNKARSEGQTSGQGQGGSRSQTPLGRTSSPLTPGGGGPPTQKSQNEAYFAKMGAENLSRPDHVPPNQGGKYAGFGSQPTHSDSNGGAGGQGAIPSADEFQKDPVAALTKGFGWLSSTVGKQASVGYNGWVKPNMQKVSCLSPASSPVSMTHFLLLRTVLQAGKREILMNGTASGSRPRNSSPPSSATSRPRNPIRNKIGSRQLQSIRRGRREIGAERSRRIIVVNISWWCS